MRSHSAVRTTPAKRVWLPFHDEQYARYRNSRCTSIAVRIPTLERLEEMTRQWNENRNSRQRKVDWQFRVEDARLKLKRLYPNL